MAPVVEAYQAMRGVAFLPAVTFVAEIGFALSAEAGSFLHVGWPFPQPAVPAAP